MVSTSKASFMFVCGGLSTEQPKGALLGMKWETTILRQAQRKTVWADTRFPRKARYSSMTAGLRPSQGNLWGWDATTHIIHGTTPWMDSTHKHDKHAYFNKTQ